MNTQQKKEKEDGDHGGTLHCCLCGCSTKRWKKECEILKDSDFINFLKRKMGKLIEFVVN